MARKGLIAVWRDALCESPLDSTTKLVGLCLTTYMNGRGYCDPSKAGIAAKASLGSDPGGIAREHGSKSGTRSVDVAIEKLIAAGFLDVQKSAGRVRWKYQIDLPPTAQEMRRSEWEAAASTSQETASNVANGAPNVAPAATESARKRLKAGSADAPARASLPEGECPDCGAVRALVPPDFIRCADCTAATPQTEAV